METISFVSLSQMTALRKNLSVIANNLANLNTVGYQSENITFKEYLVQKAPGQKISYVQDYGAWHDTAPGAFQYTGGQLDVAIKGEGYFAVQTPGGTRYTRNGHFGIDQNGAIVTQAGHQLLSGGAPIIISPNDKDIQISKDGVVSSENGQIGQMEIVDFNNKQGLKKEGNSLYKIGLATEKTAGNYSVSQGYLESSNVEGIVEMTKMMEVTRAYQSAYKAVEKEDERIRQMIRTFSQNIRQ